MRVSDGDARRREWLEALADERYRHAVAAAMRPPTRGLTHVSAPLVQTMLRLAGRVGVEGAVQTDNDEKAAAGGCQTPGRGVCENPLLPGPRSDDNHK